MQNAKYSNEYRKRSSTSLRDMYDIEKVQKETNYFVPCSIEFDEERIYYQYTIDNLENLENIRKKSVLERIKIILAISNLEPIKEEYDFSLQPNNLYYTIHGIIQIKHRDLSSEKVKYTFIEEFKSIIGYSFLKNYTYEDILQGGFSFLNTESHLAAIEECTTVEEIIMILHTWYQEEEDKQKQMLLVPKQIQMVRDIAIFVISVVLVMLSGFTIYQQFIVMKQKDIVIQANSSFIDNKYVDTIDVLKDVDTLNVATRYMLAISYIKSSSLDNEAKSNALSQAKLNGAEEYISFWIALGKKAFDEVYIIANKFSDDRLLYYAYSVEYTSLTTNDEISAQEKAMRKEELEKLLDGYVKEIEEGSTK